MSRLSHWLSNFAAAVSLIVCIATVVLWIRSLSTADTWSWHSSGTNVNQQGVVSTAGCVYFSSVPLPSMGPHPSLIDGSSPPSAPMLIARSPLEHYASATLPITSPYGASGPAVVSYEGLGFAATFDTAAMGLKRILFVLIPYWSVTAGSTLIPTVWMWRHLFHLRDRRLGLCQVCGYDLRATPDRCPECGTAPSGEEQR